MAYLYALSIDEMHGATRIAERAATVLVGPGGATFIALTVVISTFGNNAAAIIFAGGFIVGLACKGVQGSGSGRRKSLSGNGPKPATEANGHKTSVMGMVNEA